jgi:hypothetical protein
MSPAAQVSAVALLGLPVLLVGILKNRARRYLCDEEPLVTGGFWYLRYRHYAQEGHTAVKALRIAAALMLPWWVVIILAFRYL